MSEQNKNALEKITEFPAEHPNITGFVILVGGVGIFIISSQTEIACIGFGIGGSMVLWGGGLLAGFGREDIRE